MDKLVSWPRYLGIVKYRVTFRASIKGETIVVLDNLTEPRCEVPAELGVLPAEAVVRIDVAPVLDDGSQGDWLVWIPFYQLSPPNMSDVNIESPVDATEFPVRLRIRATGVDKVLLDLVLRANKFPVPPNLLDEGRGRYKFFRFNHVENKWEDVLGVADYRPLDVSSSKATLAEIGGNSVEVLGELRLPSAELRIDNCPICGDSLVKVENGQNCVGCESRARLRSMAPLMQSYLAPLLSKSPVLQLPLLSFAMTGAEKKFLTTVFQHFKSVSLFGNYASDHESGVDMRHLSRYAAGSFSGVFGCLLFDYFSEHEKALQECFRVIAPGGVFFTHIAPYRIVDGDAAPMLKGAIKSRAGYFEYLPDKTELPDVKVGRDWFVLAVRRVGFEPAIVRVKDAVPGLVSEWFVGIKPGRIARKLTEPSKAKAIIDKFEAKTSEVFRTIVPFGEKGLAAINFELIESATSSLVFLEDHYVPAPDGGGEVREIVATNGSRDRIYLSPDLGNSWVQQFNGVQWDSKIRAAFSLSNGGRLVRTFSGRMYHFDERGELVGRCNTGAWHWHGSQGIGESTTRVVMYAEYAPLREADGVQELSVWRYRPDEAAAGWQRVLTLPAAVRPPEGQIRHFHVCRPNPVNPNQWILASGDVGAHCRLWFSIDDGDTWSEVRIPEHIFPDIPENTCPRVLRFTQFSATEDGGLIWGTDDTTGSGRAALVKMTMKSGQAVFYMPGWLGKNCIRNIASYEDRLYLLLSESKHDSSSADCVLYDASTDRITSLLLPNLSQVGHPVTDSLGSERIVNRVGFFPALGAVLMHPNKRGIFRVSVEEMVQ